MSEITWAYGVTTVASRLADGLLERTLASLAKGGFPEPRLFIDGIPNVALPDFASRLQVTCRNPAIKIYGNFHLGLSELFIRNAQADRYALFQDDFVTYKNLRQYLENCPYPDKGYLNLYTFEQNVKPQQGWYLSNQLGKGGVALVFDNRAVQVLLQSPYWIGRPASKPKNPERTWKFIDGGIVETFRQQGFKEYVHNPSLVQHTGTKSTLGNSRHAQAGTFKGEDFDALSLIKNRPVAVKTDQPKRNRIGLVGYSTAQGLGELNRQLATYADVYKWLVKPHGKHPTIEPPDCVDFQVCPTGAKLGEFLKTVDTVLFTETPYYPTLPDLCTTLPRRMVCVPMMEWMPPGARGWPKQVDLFICPTKHCYDQFAHVVPCVYFPWPVDTDRFKFQQRTVCKRFLFVNGHGGYKGRKGASVIQEVLRKCPELPILIRDQSNTDWGVPTLGKVENNSDLYSEGDVLISPHSTDGLGLEGMEAMACGMPVLSTDGMPWNEIPALDRIRAAKTRMVVKRPVDWYKPNADHLIELCKKWLNQNISSQSTAAREWAEGRSWDVLATKFDDLVRSGKP